jgi:hypothetical protein
MEGMKGEVADAQLQVVAKMAEWQVVLGSCRLTHPVEGSTMDTTLLEQPLEVAVTKVEQPLEVAVTKVEQPLEVAVTKVVQSLPTWSQLGQSETEG